MREKAILIVKYGNLLAITMLLLAGCGSKALYDERGYLFNPSGVWNEFEYQQNRPYAESIAELKVRLKEVWHVRQALGRYTHGSFNDVDAIVEQLIPPDGKPAGGNCQGAIKGTALLLHGLYDSPYTMKDIGAFLNRQCYHTRFMLLPGHGTVPGDLRHLEIQQWTTAVKAVAEQTKREYGTEKLVIAGFSTGAGLALNYALEQPDDVSALFLFAPLLDLPAASAVGAGLVGSLREYIQKGEELDSFKYESVPANSVLQVNQLANSVRSRLIHQRLNMPVFIAQAKNDYTLPSDVTIDLFDKKAFGSKSVFLLYTPTEYRGFKFLGCDDADRVDFQITGKIACKSSFIDKDAGVTIDDYSHMSLILSPDDNHYGLNGDYRYCLHYSKGTNLENCKTKGKSKVCYGERGLIRGNHVSEACPEYEKVIIRLTSNPKFEQLEKILARFMKFSGI